MNRSFAKSISVVLILLGAQSVMAADGWPAGVISAPSGRYAFGQVNQMARDQFMLDTQTGRLWRMVCAQSEEKNESKCAVYVLEPVMYSADSDGVGWYLPGRPIKVK